jgi:putative membrane protein
MSLFRKLEKSRDLDLTKILIHEMLAMQTLKNSVDNMMGGEGSKSLSSMHQKMGYSYIRGDSRGMMGDSFMPMIGGGMMGRSMMGNRFGYFSYGWIIILLLTLIIIGVILYLVIRSQKRLGKIGGTYHEPPLMIAQRRYALGEITKEEYETIKQDLK